MGRLGKKHIQIHPLGICLHSCSGCKLYFFFTKSAAFCQELPLHVGNNTASRSLGRYDTVINPHKKQRLYIPEPASFYITYLDIIIRRRDYSGPYFSKTSIQKLSVFFYGNSLSRQKTHDLVKECTYLFIYLPEFNGSYLIAALIKHSCKLSHFLLKAVCTYKPVQSG